MNQIVKLLRSINVHEGEEGEKARFLLTLIEAIHPNPNEEEAKSIPSYLKKAGGEGGLPVGLVCQSNSVSLTQSIPF